MACDLVQSLQNLNKSEFIKLSYDYKQELIEIANIFNSALQDKEKQNYLDNALLLPNRVNKDLPAALTVVANA